MKEVAKQKQLPPVYMGKWATASDVEVEQELEKGTPYTYRFRVPKEGSLKINDLIRGEVILKTNEHKLWLPCYFTTFKVALTNKCDIHELISG
jgi:glutamyl/glutaminyl-tRNA synthetase